MENKLRIISEKYLSRFKSYCDLCKFKNQTTKITDNILCDIETDNSVQYEFLKEKYGELRYKMLQELTISLLESNDIRYDRLQFNSFYTKSFVLDGQELRSTVSKKTNDELAIILKNKPDDIFVFKDFGLQNSIDDVAFHRCFSNKKIRYVSFVSDNAFTEIINYNDNENDLYRGTNVISIKDFLITSISEESWDSFYEYCTEFTEKSKDIFSFGIIKNVRNSNLFSYREIVKKSIEKFDYKNILEDVSIEQHNIIEVNYFRNGLYESLVGNSTFAQSFMTAEWLYHSLHNAKNVDLTPISTGFFKALEQFLDLYVSFIVGKNDLDTNQPYVIFSIKDKHHVELSRKKYRQIKKELTLKNLTDLFGDYKNQTDSFIERNVGLLQKNITQCTYHTIIKLLNQIVSTRNGHFHKDNIQDWETVEKIRNLTYCAFYLIFGSYKYLKENRSRLGIVELENDDFYQLCDFVYKNLKSCKQKGKRIYIPVFRVDDCTLDLIVSNESIVNYDKFGRPIYKELCFKNMGEKSYYEKKYTQECQPIIVRYSFLELYVKNNEFHFKPQEFKTIFKNGKFIVNRL